MMRVKQILSVARLVQVTTSHSQNLVDTARSLELFTLRQQVKFIFAGFQEILFSTV